MPTRGYTLRLDAVIGTNRELVPEERRRLRSYIANYLNRNFRGDVALEHVVVDGDARLTGPFYFKDPTR